MFVREVLQVHLILAVLSEEMLLWLKITKELVMMAIMSKEMDEMPIVWLKLAGSALEEISQTQIPVVLYVEMV